MIDFAIEVLGFFLILTGAYSARKILNCRRSDETEKPEWNPVERERLKHIGYNSGLTSEEVDEKVREYDETHERR